MYGMISSDEEYHNAVDAHITNCSHRRQGKNALKNK